ncbi:outer membrane beta-barrel protein [bacterium]|nr:outer membrane beta-barrel protein [bacterium]
MTKRSLVLLAMLIIGLFATQASALEFEDASFYAQGAIQLPIGDWSDFVSLGFGPGVGIHVPHSDELAFRGELSYFFYSTDSDFFGDDADVSASALPILVLGQYNLEDSPVYIIGGLGLTMLSVDIEYDSAFGSFSSDDSSTEFSFVAGAGFWAGESFSIEGRFNLISDANSLQAGGVFHF